MTNFNCFGKVFLSVVLDFTGLWPQRRSSWPGESSLGPLTLLSSGKIVSYLRVV